ncbi:MAG TPA: hypothetical protein DEB12_11995 [Porphyromonadaceae bacterium]|nr:hypothetical protein [Porphyromonadaceae bacterium]
MNLHRFSIATAIFLISLISCFSKEPVKSELVSQDMLKIGWSSIDITPDKPVDLRGQFPARISEGVLDPVTATVLAIESADASSNGHAFIISCDLVAIDTEVVEAVRNKIRAALKNVNTDNIIINATHTHTAPFCSPDNSTMKRYGIELDVMAPSAYLDFMSDQIAVAAKDAWSNRKPGGISYGLGHAVVGHNRLQVDFSGNSVMYGNTNRPEFSHMEGFEDHSVNLLYTWDKKSNLTGVVVNVPCPSQVTEGIYKISADYWHDTRVELKERLGKNIYVLGQCSAAGDQSPHIRIGEKAELRMQKMMFPDEKEIGDHTVALRKQLAVRIADAVTSVLPYMKDQIEWNPKVYFQTEKVELSRRLINIDDVNKALNQSKEWNVKYEGLIKEINENPSIKQRKRWYSEVTNAYRRLTRGQSVKERYELEKVQKKLPIEINILRIGDIVMATNPFELYLDYGMRIKARCPATQTFLVQLANGSNGYLPPYRSTVGGSYGAEPASTEIGPEGGQELVEKTLEMISSVWKD